MPSKSINGSYSPTMTTYYTGASTVTVKTPGPVPRTAANGMQPYSITYLELWLRGRGAYRTLRPAIWWANGSASSRREANLTGVAAAGSANGTTGARPINGYFSLTDSPGNDIMVGYYDCSGDVYLGRHPSSYDVITTAGWTDYPNSSLSGQFTYGEVPNAPGAPYVQDVKGDSIKIGWTGSSDNGGFSVSAYIVQMSPVANFSRDITQVITSSPTAYFSGLDSSTMYYFRVSSRNYVSILASSGGPFSLVRGYETLAGGQRKTSSGFQGLSIAKRKASTGMVDITIRKRLTANGWIDLTG